MAKAKREAKRETKRAKKASALDFTTVAAEQGLMPEPALTKNEDSEDDKKGAEPLRTIYVRTSLHKLFHTHCVMRGEKMTEVADAVLTDYLASVGIVVPKRPPRANARSVSDGSQN